MVFLSSLSFSRDKILELLIVCVYSPMLIYLRLTDGTDQLLVMIGSQLWVCYSFRMPFRRENNGKSPGVAIVIIVYRNKRILW